MEMLRSLFYSLAAVFFILTIVSGQDETINVTDNNPVTIYSPGYADGNYTANADYDYVISTNLTNHTLVLKVVDCELEIAKSKDLTICHDYYEVYDGNSTSATKLGDKHCCKDGDPSTFDSSGDTLYILFKSDDSTQLKGFSMTVEADDGITTTTTTTTTTSTTSVTTAASQASSEDSRDYTWIIVGCVIGGINLIIIIVIILACFVKKSEGSSVLGNDRKVFSRSNTTVEPFTSKDVPPVEVVQTNIFDMDLPAADGKANQLPPLSQSLAPGPKENSFVIE